MPEHKSMICVGGPRGGERYAVANGSGFSIPVRVETSENDPRSEEFRPNKPVKAVFTDYHREMFHTPQGEVSFWTPVQQTPLQTITLLLESYEQSQAEIGKLRAACKLALHEMCNTVAPRNSFTDAVDTLDAVLHPPRE